MNFQSLFKQTFTSASQRSRFVATFTTVCALVYHIGVFILFGFLKIYPLFFYNIVSIAVFSFIIPSIPKAKDYVFLYTIAGAEVITHQLLGEIFLGSKTDFHFLILLIGVLPFLIFKDDFKKSVPFTLVTSILFIVLENIRFLGVRDIPEFVSVCFRIINVSFSILVIISVILIYVFIVFGVEKQLKCQNDNLESEIRLAAFIQQNFYKHENLAIKGWDLAYFSRPMAGVSGDLYDFYEGKKGVEGIGIFDVSGHGISSGLVTMLVKNIIQQEFFRNKNDELWEIVNRINERVITEKGKIQNYLTGILIRLKENQLEVVNAGHPYPIIYRKSNYTCEFLNKEKFTSGGAIGIDGFPAYYYSQFVDLNPGDEIILYTDGISDVENIKHEQFGADQFQNVIKDVAELSVNEQMKSISHRLKEFRNGTEVKDDMTVIILKKL